MVSELATTTTDDKSTKGRQIEYLASLAKQLKVVKKNQKICNSTPSKSLQDQAKLWSCPRFGYQHKDQLTRFPASKPVIVMNKTLRGKPVSETGSLSQDIQKLLNMAAGQNWHSQGAIVPYAIILPSQIYLVPSYNIKIHHMV